MLVRYKKGSGGLDAVARVYSREENRIDSSLISRNAVNVIKKLNSAGYESYLVGGAVRDMILGRQPKDFDVATSASPRQVHKLFYNSRIIGRRFRLVHITFGNEIIEVSTFRSTKEHESSNDNEYGTIEEDCTRRDFSINSLYYDPIKENLIDFNNALDDFRDRKIVSLIPLNRTFEEDPVRMVRAVKYSVTTGFRIPFRLSVAIRHNAPRLEGVSTSRMTEEVNKILACGDSCQIFRRLNSYKLLVYILPAISVYASFPQMFDSLSVLDRKVNQAKEDPSVTVTKAEMYLSLVRPFISVDRSMGTPMEVFNDILRQIKILLSPITPPNYEIESAAAMFMTESGLRVPKGAIRHRNPESAEKKKNESATGTQKTSRRRKSGNPPRSVRHSRPARSV
ncbi:MAG: polynucleotide adenylyltransferase PcnB [bacterium]|nr:polynucleotide adenylyltransferase PcnB [Spirochaetales bacterium]MDT3389219.1 polynucleotide adenylyltransferase PcnB [bacterium]